jgi:cobalamin biosynthesis protein CobT
MSAVRVLGDALDAEGREFSLLGYTTSKWKGGRSRKDWHNAGRPRLPGRLNDLLHITFKSFEEDWSQCREDIKLAFVQGVLKENIDGEAFQWARQAQLDAGVEGSIVHICDGPSMDDSTHSVNLMGILDDHRSKVLDDFEQEGVPFRTVNVEKVTGDLSLRKVDPEASTCAAFAHMMRDAIHEMDAEMAPSETPGIT